MDYVHHIVFYRNLTPLHIGCGQDVGVVDLPVIREKATGFPFIPGSGTRGSLRDSARTISQIDESKKPTYQSLFGPEPGENTEENSFAGSLSVHDARLLFFPVRSDHQVFLYVTCPFVLQRWNRDLSVFLIESNAMQSPSFLSSPVSDEKAISPVFAEKIFLEEFPVKCEKPEAEKGKALKKWLSDLDGKTGTPGLAQRFVLVSDRFFRHLVMHATQVMMHNALTSAKTVKKGALFSVESLPPESLFYGVMGTSRKRDGSQEPNSDAAEQWTNFETLLFNAKKKIVLHLGGDESTGLGVSELYLV
ncbi:type III-B CRISPR module RAMP protein Cmr4 [candidate division KSB1 bacterium]|nr:type III-B CRISPR module RAMP protein Cmr4 [candidate division KSB1 bacterium]